MKARLRLPAGFWLLLGIASLFGSLLTWTGQRIDAKRQIAAAARAAVMNASAAAAASSEPAAAPADPGHKTRAPPAIEATPAPAVSQPPRMLPMAPSTGIKVLRCTVRGRVTYIDTASACPDGSPGKITLLPR